MTRRTEQIGLHLNAYLCAQPPPDAILREQANETADPVPGPLILPSVSAAPWRT